MITIKLKKAVGTDENGNEIIENKTYIAPNPKAKLVRRAFEISETINPNTTKASDLDEMVQFVVELFGNKFTVDDFWDGIDANKLISTILNCINGLMDEMKQHIGAVPNA